MPEILNGLSSWFEINMGLSADTQLKILWTLAVLSILFLTHYVICFLFSVRVKDAARRYTRRKTMTMALSTAGLVFFLRIWIAGRHGLAAYLGILSAGLAIANYNQGFNFIWNEIGVLVTFESDWKKAKEILMKIAEAHTAVQSAHAEAQVRAAARKFLIFFQHLTPIVWTNVEDCGVKLTMRYLCEPRKRRSSQAAIWEAVLEAFSRESGIDFAYPTIRRYDDRAEGKVQQARAER